MRRKTALAVLVVALSTRAVLAQGLHAPADALVAPTAEGALDNDVFVPVAETVQEALTQGDAALGRARDLAGAGTPGEAERLLDTAFDHWHAALTRSPPGSWCWYDAGAASPRRLCEGIEAAVGRRLLALSKAERERWSTRLRPAARVALERLEGLSTDQRPALALTLVRQFPHTLAAAQAALQLGDLALESGLPERALSWFARAELEVGLAGGSEPLERVLGPRQAAQAGRRRATEEAWRSASAAEFADSSAFEPLRAGPRTSAVPGERRPRPGGTFLPDGRFAVQTAEELLIYALSPSGTLALSSQIRIDEHLEGSTPELHFDAPREAPGWPLVPAACGEHLAVVVGRTHQEEPNVLLVLELEPPQPHAGLSLDLGRGPPRARTAWALLGSELVCAEDSRVLAELDALGEFEFQPCPVATSDWIVVQVRAYAGRVRAWLFAFDRRDGSPAWGLELASGAERVVTPRFSAGPPRSAAQPLLAFELEGEARVFAGTHLGLGALVDALTGAPLFGLKNRRRAEHESGWSGDRPVLGACREGTPSLLWAPMDSDRLYTLRPFALASAGDEDGAAQLAVPAPLGDAERLLGGDAREHLVLGNTGRERTVSARRPGKDRVDALDLGEDERFRGAGLVSPERVWVATDRSLYLFDRTRELYLLDSAVLPPTADPPAGGDLYGHGAHVLVLGRSAVWSFLAR